MTSDFGKDFLRCLQSALRHQIRVGRIAPAISELQHQRQLLMNQQHSNSSMSLFQEQMRTTWNVIQTWKVMVVEAWPVRAPGAPVEPIHNGRSSSTSAFKMDRSHCSRMGHTNVYTQGRGHEPPLSGPGGNMIAKRFTGRYADPRWRSAAGSWKKRWSESEMMTGKEEPRRSLVRSTKRTMITFHSTNSLNS